jgi:hypothetical protein
MRSLGFALRLVFSRRGYMILAGCAMLLSAALFSYAGQMVTVYGDGSVFVDTDPTHVAALAVLSALMGLAVSMQIFALRHAIWRPRQGGAGMLGVIAGLGSMTCCSPLLLPSLLSFIGFSGSSLLTMNYTLYRYFRPLAALSGALLLLSLLLAARDITRACRMPS